MLYSAETLAVTPLRSERGPKKPICIWISLLSLGGRDCRWRLGQLCWLGHRSSTIFSSNSAVSTSNIDPTASTRHEVVHKMMSYEKRQGQIQLVWDNDVSLLVKQAVSIPCASSDLLKRFKNLLDMTPNYIHG